MKELEKQINRILQRLEADKLFKNKVQNILREFVTDKTYPLEKRFEIWKLWCDKDEHLFIIHEHDVPVIGKWVDECIPTEFDKYRDYDWVFFLEHVEEACAPREDDDFIYGYETDILEDISSVDHFKELLIETNFGSFKCDW